MALLKWGPKPVRGQYTLEQSLKTFAYIFVYSTTTEDPDTVRNDVYAKYQHRCGIVLAGTRYYCKQITPEQQPDGKVWFVAVTYEQLAGTAALSSEVTPLNEPWTISFGHTSKRRALVKAYSYWRQYLWIDGHASADNAAHGKSSMDANVGNSFGDPFDPAYEKEIRLLVISVSKNISTAAYNSAKPLEYDGTLNKSQLVVCGHTLAPWTGFLTVEGRRQTYINAAGNPAFYMAMSYGITVDPDKWAVRFVDAGMRYKKYADPNKDSVITATVAGMVGHRESKPVKLDGMGHSLNDANSDGAGKVAALQCYFTDLEKDWGSLQFPSSVLTE